MQTIPRDTFIRYGDSENIYLDVQKFVYLSRSNSQQLEIIRKHLLTIAALISPEEKTLTALGGAPILENLGYSSKSREAEFVKNILAKANKTMANLPAGSDPMEAVSSMLGSGILQEVVSGLEDGYKNKTIDPEKLMEGLQTTIMESIGDEHGKAIDVGQITVAVQQLMKKNEENSSYNPENLIDELKDAVIELTGCERENINTGDLEKFCEVVTTQTPQISEKVEDVSEISENNV